MDNLFLPITLKIYAFSRAPFSTPKSISPLICPVMYIYTSLMLSFTLPH